MELVELVSDFIRDDSLFFVDTKDFKDQLGNVKGDG